MGTLLGSFVDFVRFLLLALVFLLVGLHARLLRRRFLLVLVEKAVVELLVKVLLVERFLRKQK